FKTELEHIRFIHYHERGKGFSQSTGWFKCWVRYDVPFLIFGISWSCRNKNWYYVLHEQLCQSLLLRCFSSLKRVSPRIKLLANIVLPLLRTSGSTLPPEPPLMSMNRVKAYTE